MKFNANYPVFIVISAMISLSFLSSCKKSNSNPTPISTIDSLKIGLVAYYPFNSNANDASGNGNAGTLNSVTSTTDRNGKANAAYQFDGVQSYISVPDKQALRLANTDFTLNAWIKMDAYNAASGSVILAKRITGPNNGYTWGVHGLVDANAGKVTYGPGGGSNNAFSNGTVPIGSWHMVTAEYTLATAQLRIYIDGTLNSVSDGISSANPNITTLLFIGGDDPSLGTSYFFQGSLDEIRIYSRVLSNNDLQKLYTSTN
ncbi:MAG TPA: LamG domain-containing protein [Mucilaginibacter sp.]|nr:LamG domain-containing protein [Mucilaginibacter sp.]